MQVLKLKQHKYIIFKDNWNCLINIYTILLISINKSYSKEQFFISNFISNFIFFNYTNFIIIWTLIDNVLYYFNFQII